jgi:hypothetical protein
MSHNKLTHIKDLLEGSGLTFIVVFVMEMIEEGLENLIALGISTLCSTILLVCFTQAAKLGIKKLIKWIMPFAKTLIYKEGNDKMKLLKNYWTRVWGNKITGTSIGLGFAGISYFQTLIPLATHCLWIALIVFVVFFKFVPILFPPYLLFPLQIYKDYSKSFNFNNIFLTKIFDTCRIKQMIIFLTAKFLKNLFIGFEPTTKRIITYSSKR